MSKPGLGRETRRERVPHARHEHRLAGREHAPSGRRRASATCRGARRRVPSGACSRPCRWGPGRWCRRPRRGAAPCRRRATPSRGRPASAGSTAAPPAGSTTAQIVSPKRSSGMPTTTASRTAGWVFSASSTSSGKTFSPPVLMHTEPRPSRCSVPSALTSAQSPGTLHRLPSNVRNVCAGLDLVLVVAERDEAADGDHAPLAAARLDAAAVLGEHRDTFAEHERGRLARGARSPTPSRRGRRPPTSRTSRTGSPGACGAAGRSLFSWLHITPDELIERSTTGRSWPGLASRPASIGPANAWPTITIEVTCRSLTRPPQLGDVELAVRQRHDRRRRGSS